MYQSQIIPSLFPPSLDPFDFPALLSPPSCLPPLLSFALVVLFLSTSGVQVSKRATCVNSCYEFNTMWWLVRLIVSLFSGKLGYSSGSNSRHEGETRHHQSKHDDR